MASQLTKQQEQFLNSEEYADYLKEVSMFSQKKERVTNLIWEARKLCPYGFSILFHEHKQSHQSAKDYIDMKINLHVQSREEIGEEVIAEMIQQDVIVEVRGYDRTTIGFYEIMHYDLETALDRLIATIKGDS